MSLDDGVTGMLAMDAGISPHLVKDTGVSAQDLLSYIRDASRAKSAQAKARFLKKAKTSLNDMNADTHGELVQAVQARILALQGRGGDTELAHLTPDEVIVPRQLQTPDVMAALQRAAARAGVDLQRYIPGSPANVRNPATSIPEFQDHSGQSDVQRARDFNVNKFIYDSVRQPGEWLSEASPWLTGASTYALLHGAHVPSAVLGSASTAAMFAGEGFKRWSDKISEDCVRSGLKPDCGF